MTPIEWPLHTQRLSLRGYMPDDLDGLWAFERLPQVQRWLGWAPRSREELHQKMTDESSNTVHVVVLLESVIIGHIMIMPRDGWAQTDVASRAKGVEAELGWMSTRRTESRATPRKQSGPRSGSASARSVCGASGPDASPTTPPPGG